MHDRELLDNILILLDAILLLLSVETAFWMITPGEAATIYLDSKWCKIHLIQIYRERQVRCDVDHPKPIGRSASLQWMSWLNISCKLLGLDSDATELKHLPRHWIIYF